MWNELLYARFRDQPYPLFVFEDATLPAASVWTGMRHWVDAFRAAGLSPGDRVVLALPPGPGFLTVLLAALWERLTLAFVPASTDVPACCEALDARLGVVPSGTRSAGTWTASPAGPPARTDAPLRPPRTPATPDVRFLLRTSGTTGPGRWIGLSDDNVQAVLDSHRRPLNRSGACVLSVLPWHHAFGLVLDLLPALLAGATVVREPSGGRDPASIQRTGRALEATHLSAVPLTIERLLASEPGRAFLQGLEGGVVGGAPITRDLAEALSPTALRVGYGQTEASPGILLGAPGTFAPYYIGQPVGCSVRITAKGTLAFQGPNAHHARWAEGRMTYLAPDRWVDTGDRVRHEPGMGYFYEGRANTTFKLANGRAVTASVWESRLHAAIPTLRAALVFPNEDGRLDVGLWTEPSHPPPSRARVATVMAPLADWLGTVHLLPSAVHHRTPKGSMDRHATQAAVHRHVHATPSSALS